MVQLRVYTDETKTVQQYIDLYETEPIKLNLSIEDITSAEASSVFSRTFRVPANGNNNKFFKHAFLVDGIDYDVTVKKPAEILVDGAEFRQGHIRLQKIYNDKYRDRIDYEILFLGETRDFSSQIGDAPMCNLNVPSLEHVLNRDNIVASWDAYPESASATAGLQNGDVIYPLIDHGNVYPINNANPRISFEGSHTFHNNPLPADRMKPMIRAKALWDQIFEDAGYTYTSEFIDPTNGDPNIFTQLYVSAFGNEADPIFDTSASSANNFEATTPATLAANDRLYIPIEVSDPGSNYTPGTSNTGSFYTVPVTGSYRFTASMLYYGEFEQSAGPDPIDGRIVLVDGGGLPIATGSWGYGSILTLDTGLIQLPANTDVYIVVETEYSVDYSSVDTPTWACISSPGLVNPISSMDCEYKQIDFIKDVLTTFRLVMSPDPFDAKNFIVEPWVDYINGGDLYDWSDKLVEDKDQVLEPLFFTQSDQIKFKHEPDGDWLNDYHQKAYSHTYGYLEFDSGNELLTGSREIKTNWAPTPMTHIEGVANTSPFVIPQLHVHENADGATEHLAIKPKSRFLFYTGLHAVGDNQNTWELVNNTHIDQFPLVTYSNTWPIVDGSTILNWRNDVGYWGGNVSGYPTQGGASLYDLYWGAYINSLYSKFARRLTAYFVLNNVDLQTFSFDDVIFVNGTYYRPEKIIDAQIGERMPTKVQLIKLLNYNVPRVPPLFTLSLGFGYNTQVGACAETVVEQTVTYYPPLTAGSVVGNMDVIGDLQYFKILGSTEPGFPYIGQVVEIDNNLEVITIDECEAPQPTPTATPVPVPVTPTATPVPVPVTPTPTPGPTTYYARFVECDDPAGAVIEVFDSNPISTGLVLKDNNVCYQYLNVGGSGVNGDIGTFQQFDNCETCSPVVTPTPTPTPVPLSPTPTPTATPVPSQANCYEVTVDNTNGNLPGPVYIWRRLPGDANASYFDTSSNLGTNSGGNITTYYVCSDVAVNMISSGGPGDPPRVPYPDENITFNNTTNACTDDFNCNPGPSGGF